MEDTKQTARRRRRPILDLASHILERIRVDGPLSRVELARRIGVGPATSGSYVERMIEAGMLRECVDSSSAYPGKGRPPTLVELNPGGGALVGLDLEGPVLRAVRFDFCLNVESERVVDLPAEVGSTMLRRTVNRAIEAVRPAEGVNWLGIGVAAPSSLLHPELGQKEERPGRIKIFDGINAEAFFNGLRERFECPVVAENDMCCIAYGERLAGAGKECEHFLSVASRAGWTGAALFANGELTAGPQRGLDIGAWLLSIRDDLKPKLDSIKDRDGRRRYSLNTLCSPEGMQALYLEHRQILGERGALPGGFGFPELCECFCSGDKAAVEAVDVVARAIGRVAARADDILIFDRIVLDGIFQELGEDFTRMVERHFRDYSMRYEDAGSEKIIFSDLGDRAASYGAAGQLLRNFEASPRIRDRSSAGG